jgi:hypothetical protein
MTTKTKVEGALTGSKVRQIDDVLMMGFKIGKINKKPLLQPSTKSYFTF